MKILNEVVDSLDLRVYRYAAPSDWLLGESNLWRLYKESWEPKADPLYSQIDGVGTFKLRAGGRAPYEFILTNPQICDIRIWNPDRWAGPAVAQTGQLFISFRSVFLQHHGLDGVKSVISALTDLLFDASSHYTDSFDFDRISRIDLAVDLQEDREISWSELDNFVCRSRKFDTWSSMSPQHLTEKLNKKMLSEWLLMGSNQDHSQLEGLSEGVVSSIMEFTRDFLLDLEQRDEASLSRVISEGRKPQTIYFGRFGSELYARRYNKLGSLKVQDKLYMLDIWASNGWDRKSPVTRTEFSLSGDFLKDFRDSDSDYVADCRDLSTIEDNIPMIWSYLTKKWLRLTVNDSNNVSYRSTDNCWELIQSAHSGKCVLPGYRDRSRRHIFDDVHLIKQARGCSVTATALRFITNRDASYSDIVENMFKEISETMSKPQFLDDVRSKIYEYGLDDYTDTCFTAMIRSQHMRLGLGS